MTVNFMLTRYADRANRLTRDEIADLQSDFRLRCSSSSLAINTQDANIQHYEVPVSFFKSVLGTSMKYSGSFWDSDTRDIDTADLNALEKYDSRACVEDGQNILDIGAGWGSMSLYLAQKYKKANITAVTNSRTQHEYIKQEITKIGLKNIEVIRCDVNQLDFDREFDRIFAIEMLEHTRNTGKLMQKISEWLTLDGKFFFQVFTHRMFPQLFDNKHNSWMSRYFFTGGMMPYMGFYEEIDSGLLKERSWIENGTSYHKTLESWIDNLDSSNLGSDLCEISHSDSYNPKLLRNRFMIFLIICSELFKFNMGEDWYLMNYLFTKNKGVS
ncbi:MAG: class I SAM-dependent methyltransferase [Chloroflexota bacterium]|nr:class I SAM-dependent methyltransferase [Chloroflexota bacterium]